MSPKELPELVTVAVCDARQETLHLLIKQVMTEVSSVKTQLTEVGGQVNEMNKRLLVDNGRLSFQTILRYHSTVIKAMLWVFGIFIAASIAMGVTFWGKVAVHVINAGKAEVAKADVVKSEVVKVITVPFPETNHIGKIK